MHSLQHLHAGLWFPVLSLPGLSVCAIEWVLTMHVFGSLICSLLIPICRIVEQVRKLQVWHTEAVDAATWLLAGIVRVPLNAEVSADSLHDQLTQLAQGVGECSVIMWHQLYCNASVHPTGMMLLVVDRSASSKQYRCAQGHKCQPKCV